MRNTVAVLVLVLVVFTSLKAEFTFVVIPDTQVLSENDYNAQFWYNSMDWIVEQKDELNVVFVSHLGDMTQHWTNWSQWGVADNAMDILTQGDIPWAPAKGNHDDVGYLRETFPVSNWEKEPWFGNYFGGMENAYYLFTWEGTDYIVVVVTDLWSYGTAEVNWASEILEEYPDRHAIAVSHNITQGSFFVDEMVQHDNVFLVLGGHDCARELNWTETSPSGNDINIFMSDYQCDGAEASSMLRYYTFKPEEDKICVFTYHPTWQTYESDGNSQFCFDFQMEPSTDPRVTISNASKIEEGAEDGKTIDVVLANDVFVDWLDLSQWSMDNLPAGVTLGSVTRSDDTSAVLTLLGNSTPGTYTTDISNISVTVLADEFTVSEIELIATSRVILTKGPSVISGKIEAEEYSDMSDGIRSEECKDTGGGKDLGYIKDGSWIEYDVSVLGTGEYDVNFRIAAESAVGRVELLIDGVVLLTEDLKVTYGWQEWKTVSTSVELTAGVHTLKLSVITGGFNLNWIEFIGEPGIESSATNDSNVSSESTTLSVAGSSNEVNESGETNISSESSVSSESKISSTQDLEGSSAIGGAPTTALTIELKGERARIAVLPYGARSFFIPQGVNRISLYDISGNKIFEREVFEFSEQEYVLPKELMRDGVYFVKFMNKL